MKKITLFIIAFLPLIVKAQTITTSDLPVAGLAWITANDSTYTQAIPSGGTGQNWDYSGLQNLVNDTVGFISAIGTPYASIFPGSNLAGLDLSTSTYSYFTTNSNGLYLDGIANSANVFVNNPSALYFPTPFSYGDARNTYSRIQVDTVYQGNNVRVILRTNSTFSADATGNLTLPSGQFNNILRIRETSITYDSIFANVGGFYIPVSNSASQVTKYSFMMPGNAVVLIMGLEADSLGQFATSSSYFTGAFVNGIQIVSDKGDVKAYPNPSFSDLNIDFSTLSDVSLIEVFDEQGHLVSNFKPGSSEKISISTMNLKNGIYYYSIKGKNGSSTGSFIVQH